MLGGVGEEEERNPIILSQRQDERILGHLQIESMD